MAGPQGVDADGRGVSARRLLGTGGFTLACALGVVVALVLAVHQAARRDPVRVSDQQHHIDGGVITASATVANHSSARRCPDVRLAVLDSEAKTVTEVPAHAAGGGAALQPGQRVGYTAEVRSLTARQLREDARKISIYVYDGSRC